GDDLDELVGLLLREGEVAGQNPDGRRDGLRDHDAGGIAAFGGPRRHADGDGGDPQGGRSAQAVARVPEQPTPFGGQVVLPEELFAVLLVHVATSSGSGAG